MTVDVAEFVLARIGEDEAAARAAEHEGHWTPFRTDVEGWVGPDGHQGCDWNVSEVEEHPEDYPLILGVASGSEQRREAVARHIARHDPARVLAECEAKRMMLELHSPHVDMGYGLPCRELTVLALPYADHPDYQEEWKP